MGHSDAERSCADAFEDPHSVGKVYLDLSPAPSTILRPFVRPHTPACCAAVTSALLGMVDIDLLPLLFCPANNGS
jgi:hypothetical protein